MLMRRNVLSRVALRSTELCNVDLCCALQCFAMFDCVVQCSAVQCCGPLLYTNMTESCLKFVPQHLN